MENIKGDVQEADQKAGVNAQKYEWNRGKTKLQKINSGWREIRNKNSKRYIIADYAFYWIYWGCL